jgi:hypothetical protein
MGFLYEACDQISDLCLIRFLLPVCRFCWFLYTFNIHLYMHIFRRIFLSNYWWQESDIWSQASYIKVGKQEVGNWWVQKHFPRYGVPIWSLWPNIRSLPSIVAEKNVTKKAFVDPSDSYFLFAKERGYHRWALARSSSCLAFKYFGFERTSHDMGYLYEACDQISDLCHQ